MPNSDVADLDVHRHPDQQPGRQAAQRSDGSSPGPRWRSTSRPRKPAAAPITSTCPAATSPHSSSGFADQSRWARARRAGSERSIRSRASATAPNAIAFQSFSQKTIRAADVPPSSAAAHCSAGGQRPVDGHVLAPHGAGVASPTGSPVRRSWFGVIMYGVVAEHDHPAVRGVVEGVGGSGRRQHGERATAANPTASSSRTGSSPPRAARPGPRPRRRRPGWPPPTGPRSPRRSDTCTESAPGRQPVRGQPDDRDAPSCCGPPRPRS